MLKISKWKISKWKISRLKKGDLILGVILIAIILVSFAAYLVHRSTTGEMRRIAVIMYAGRTLHRIDLDSMQETKLIRLETNSNILIEVSEGRIRFLESDCPDKICIKTGWLKDIGDTSICVPGKTVIRIEGSKENEGNIGSSTDNGNEGSEGNQEVEGDVDAVAY